jgi:CRP-like cAMP-binding protein
MASSSTVVKQLQNLHLFRNVSQKDLSKLTQMCQILEFRPRQIIFAQNAPADHAMILVSGKLDVCILTGHGERHLGTILPGEIFGEQGLFHSGGTRSAMVRGNKDSICLLVTPELMRETWNNEAIVALEQFLIATMARRIRNTNLEIQKIWKSEDNESKNGEHKANEQSDESGGLLGRLKSLFGGK